MKKETLIQKIDAIKGVCEESKPGIRALVSEITGIDLIETTYRVGQRFNYKNRCIQGRYILIQNSGKVAAANLATGRTRTDRLMSVDRVDCITKEELTQIFGDHSGQIITPD